MKKIQTFVQMLRDRYASRAKKNKWARAYSDACRSVQVRENKGELWLSVNGAPIARTSDLFDWKKVLETARYEYADHNVNNR